MQVSAQGARGGGWAAAAREAWCSGTGVRVVVVAGVAAQVSVLLV